MCDARSHHSRTVASDPQEPGADRRRPAPKKVATRLAHLGAGFDGLAASLWLSEGLIGVVGIVGLWVAQRRGDDVRTTRPLAEVDQTASVAAERELGVSGLHRLLADRAPEFDGALARHSRIAVVRGSIAEVPPDFNLCTLTSDL